MTFPDDIDDDDAADALSYGGEKSKKRRIHPAMAAFGSGMQSDDDESGDTESDDSGDDSGDDDAPY
jgi:hypothetical protein